MWGPWPILPTVCYSGSRLKPVWMKMVKWGEKLPGQVPLRIQGPIFIKHLYLPMKHTVAFLAMGPFSQVKKKGLGEAASEKWSQCFSSPFFLPQTRWYPQGQGTPGQTTYCLALSRSVSLQMLSDHREFWYLLLKNYKLMPFLYTFFLSIKTSSIGRSTLGLKRTLYNSSIYGCIAAQ